MKHPAGSRPASEYCSTHPYACSLSSRPPSPQQAQPAAACQSAHTPCSRRVQEQGVRHVECVAAAALHIPCSRRRRSRSRSATAVQATPRAPATQMHVHLPPCRPAALLLPVGCSATACTASPVGQHLLHSTLKVGHAAHHNGGSNRRGWSVECTLWHAHHWGRRGGGAPAPSQSLRHRWVAACAQGDTSGPALAPTALLPVSPTTS